MKKLIEICCGCVEDVVEASKGGAMRVELNSALELGGLTPSLASLVDAKRRVNIPIIAMVRSRTGGFCYTDLEFKTMLYDARYLLENGADGLAAGILTPKGEIDIRRTQHIADVCHHMNKDFVFHRAIDVTPDLVASAKALIDIGTTRILTSGGKAKCFDGIENINRLIEECGDKIEILACGGIRPSNLVEIVSKTPCQQFHMALMKEREDTSMKKCKINFNGTPSENTHKTIDREQVTLAVNVVNRF